MKKLGLIAGGGGLPVEIAEHCRRSGRALFVIRLKGFAGAELSPYAGAEVGIAEFGKCFKALHRAGCSAVCLAGKVDRPDFSALMPDLRGLTVLPALITAARQGDDALLRVLVAEFEKEGFTVEGAHQVMEDLGLAAGPIGKITPSEADMADLHRALEVARAIGGLEGTDAMLTRVAELAEAVRGRPGASCGVLAKAPKPIQETRVDLPTIGPATVHAVARAGLSGIVGEAGGLLVLDRETVIELADELGVFIFGVEPDTP
jgi:DUF1009 family protein